MKISHNSLSSSPLSFTANIIVLLVIPSVNNLSTLRNAAAVTRSSARPIVRRVANNSSIRKEKGRTPECGPALGETITEFSAINQPSRGREKRMVLVKRMNRWIAAREEKRQERREIYAFGWLQWWE